MEPAGPVDPHHEPTPVDPAPKPVEPAPVETDHADDHDHDDDGGSDDEGGPPPSDKEDDDYDGDGPLPEPLKESRAESVARILGVLEMSFQNVDWKVLRDGKPADRRLIKMDTQNTGLGMVYEKEAGNVYNWTCADVS